MTCFQVIWTNSYGVTVSFSYVPVISVIVSLVSLLVNNALAINVFGEDAWPLWIGFLLATVAARLQVYIYPNT